jgi:hypothetical protein
MAPAKKGWSFSKQIGLDDLVVSDAENQMGDAVG